jgi:hypothetical protein
MVNLSIDLNLKLSFKKKTAFLSPMGIRLFSCRGSRRPLV